jgi:hypothetical protein
MPYGPIWCVDCGFRVEGKTAQPNPFLGPVQAADGPPEAMEGRDESHEVVGNDS